MIPFVLQALLTLPWATALPDCFMSTGYPLDEQLPDVVAQPQWGRFFAHGELHDGVWSSEKRLPPFRIDLALPPPFKGELSLRHLGAEGPWCSGELRVEEYEGRLDHVWLHLPLEASWRISRDGRVLAKGMLSANDVVFAADEIVVSYDDNSGRAERFPIARATWAAPSVFDIEKSAITLPNFRDYRAFLDRHRIVIETLAHAAPPWPQVALNLAVADFVEKEQPDGLGFSEADRTRALSLLTLINKQIPAQRKPEVTRWRNRLAMFDGTLGAQSAEIHFAPQVREMRINGKTVFHRGDESKTASSHLVPVPRYGLGYVELMTDVFYANSGIHAVHREAAWVSLLPGMQIDADSTLVLHPPAQRWAGCVVLQWSGPSERAPGFWSLVHAGTSSRHAVGEAVRLPTFNVEVVPSGAPVRFTLWSLVPGTATFTLDEHGAVVGAFDPSDHCAR